MPCPNVLWSSLGTCHAVPVFESPYLLFSLPETLFSLPNFPYNYLLSLQISSQISESHLPWNTFLISSTRPPPSVAPPHCLPGPGSTCLSPTSSWSSFQPFYPSKATAKVPLPGFNCHGFLCHLTPHQHRGLNVSFFSNISFCWYFKDVTTTQSFLH